MTNSKPRRWTRTAAVALLAAVVASVVVTGAGLAGPGAAAAEQKPRIEISIDNGGTEITAGGEVDYTITVHNKEHVDYPEAVVSQLLPRSLVYGSAAPRVDSAAQNQVQWKVELPAGTKIRLRMTGRVRDAETARVVAGKPRLTTTACVAEDGGSELASCASYSAAIVKPSSSAVMLGVLAIVAGVMLVAAIAVVWHYRRRRSRAPAAEGVEPAGGSAPAGAPAGGS